MFKRWLARRFKDDETAKWTLSIFCGAGGLIVFLVVMIALGVKALERVPH